MVVRLLVFLSLFAGCFSMVTRRAAVGFGAMLPVYLRSKAAFGKGLESVAGRPGFQTKSGVKYFELAEGAGKKLTWGDVAQLRFTAFVQRSKDTEAEFIYDWGGKPILFKHGSGRQIEGLEDGIHAMRVGGKRRILVPARLAFVTGNAGPIPRSTGGIKKLQRALDAMEPSGEIIFEVQLLSAYRDEADMGFYDDEEADSLSEGSVPAGVDV